MNKQNFFLYADTDSNFCTLDPFLDVLGLRGKSDDEICDGLDVFIEANLQPLINEYFTREADIFNGDNVLKMKRESIAKRVFFKNVKKHYAMLVKDEEGVRFEDPELKIKGISTVKSSFPKPCRKALTEFIRMLLKFDDPFSRESISQTERFIKDFKKEFMQLSPMSISCPSSISALKVGKGAQLHMRGATVWNNYLKTNNLDLEPILPNSKMKYILIREPNPFSSNVFGFIDYLPEEITVLIDWEKMFYKTFLATVEEIVTPLKIDIDIYNKRTTINSFFTKQS